MGMIRWGASAVAALLFAGGAVLAGDTADLASMKSTMEEMRSEMASLRSQIHAQESETRSFAGGAPEALRSRNGRAALRIGGRMRTRYRSTWADSDDHNFAYRRYRDRFDLRDARLDFQADFTPDTTAFLRLNLEASRTGGNGAHGVNQFIDEAWWQWRNICGTGINLRVGKMQVPFGEQYNGVLPVDSYNDNDWEHVVYGNYQNARNRDGTLNHNNGVVWQENAGGTGWTPGTLFGVGPEVSAKFGDFTLAVMIFDGAVNSYGGGGNFTAKNNAQYSAWVNSAIKLEYDPSLVEGLHVSASYMGLHNYGRNAGVQAPGVAANRVPYGANYSPAFNLAADLTYCSFNFFFENTMMWNGVVAGDGRNVNETSVLGDLFRNTMTVGATYNWTSRMSFTGMFDWHWSSTPKRTWNTPGRGQNKSFRGTIGGQYDFGNGIVLQAAYAHTWSHWSVERSWRHTDEITVQSVVSF